MKKQSEYQSLRFARNGSADKGSNKDKESVGPLKTAMQFRSHKVEMDQGQNQQGSTGVRPYSKESKGQVPGKMQHRPIPKRCLRGRSDHFRSQIDQNESLKQMVANSNQKSRKLSVGQEIKNLDFNYREVYSDRFKHKQLLKESNGPPQTAPLNKLKAANLSPRRTIVNRNGSSRENRKRLTIQNEDISDILVVDDAKNQLADYASNEMSSDQVQIVGNNSDSPQSRARSTQPHQGATLLDKHIQPSLSPMETDFPVSKDPNIPSDKLKADSNYCTAQFGKLIESRFQSFYNIELKNNRNLINHSKSMNKPSARNSLSPSPIRVEGGINAAPGVRKFSFYVYSGNYPHHIENALMKRGIWKKFDKRQLKVKTSLNLSHLSPNDLKHYNQVLDTQKQLQQKIKQSQLELQAIKNLIKFNQSQIRSPVDKTEQERVLCEQKRVILQNIKTYEEQIAEAVEMKKKIKESVRSEMEATQKLDGFVLKGTDLDEAIIEKCHFIWKPFNYYENLLQRKIDKRMIRCSAGTPMVLNHFECLKAIGTKSGLIRSLKQYYYTNQHAKLCGYSIFDSTPTTFLVQGGPGQESDPQLLELMQRYKQIQKQQAPKEKVPMKHCIQNIWLVKPTNLNQGRGIEIFSDLDKMLNFIGSRSAGTLCVVQKYIERPLLYRGRKFDIRVWALMTTSNEIYFFKKGYLRTSSSSYSLDQEDTYIHLTNQCLQVKNKKIYGQHEEGNTLSFEQFQDYLNSQEFIESRPGLDKNGIQIERDILPRMKDLIIDSFCAVKNQVNPNRRKNHFELFGYDFLIDEDFRTWLIEINSNPYIGTPCKYMKDLIPKMVDEVLTKVLDPHFPPSKSYSPPENPLFELIYQESPNSNPTNMPKGALSPFRNADNYENQLINHRRPFSHALLYPLNSISQNRSLSPGKKAKHLMRHMNRQLAKYEEENVVSCDEQTNKACSLNRKKNSVSTKSKSIYASKKSSTVVGKDSFFNRQSRSSLHRQDSKANPSPKPTKQRNIQPIPKLVQKRMSDKPPQKKQQDGDIVQIETPELSQQPIIQETVLDNVISPINETIEANREGQEVIKVVPIFHRCPSDVEVKNQKSVPQSARVQFVPFMPEQEQEKILFIETGSQEDQVEKHMAASLKPNQSDTLSTKHDTQASSQTGLVNKINSYLRLSPVQRSSQKMKSQVFNQIVNWLQSDILNESESKQDQIAAKLSQFFESLDKVTNINYSTNCSTSVLVQLVILGVRPERQISLEVKKALIEFVTNSQASEKFKEMMVADMKLIEQLVELHRVLQSELFEMNQKIRDTNGLPKNTAIRSLKKKNQKTAVETSEKLEDFLMQIVSIRQARTVQRASSSNLRSTKQLGTSVVSSGNLQMLFLKCIKNGLLGYLLIQPRVSQFILNCLNSSDLQLISKQNKLMTERELKQLAQILEEFKDKNQAVKTQSPAKYYGNDKRQADSYIHRSVKASKDRRGGEHKSSFEKTRTPLKRDQINLYPKHRQMASESIKTPVKSQIDKHSEKSKTLMKTLKSAQKNEERKTDKKQDSQSKELLPHQIFTEQSNSMIATENAHMQLKEQISSCNRMIEENNSKMIDIQSKFNDIANHNMKYASNLLVNQKFQSPILASKKDGAKPIAKNSRKRTSMSVVSETKQSKAKGETPKVRPDFESKNLMTSMPSKQELRSKVAKEKPNKPSNGLEFILQQSKVLADSRLSYVLPTKKQDDRIRNKSLFKDSSVTKLDSSKVTHHQQSPSLQQSFVSKSRAANQNQKQPVRPKDKMIKKYLHNLVNESFESSPSPIKELKTDYYRVDFGQPRGSENIRTTTFENPYVVKNNPAASSLICSPLRTTKPMRS